MSRYRQSFNEALAQVEKWSKDVEVKSTGEHAGKTIAQLKKEVDALRGKPDNEKKMGGLLFAIRAKQGWKKGEGSTGVGEATQIKHEKGEVKVGKAERGERKAGESEDDYEDRESGGAKGFRPDPNKKKKKQDDLDRDDEAQATRSKVRPTAEGKLPPHLAKFFDKKGNPNPEAAKRMAAGQKKRAVVTKVKDVTPKGYGPSEDIDILHAEVNKHQARAFGSALIRDKSPKKDKKQNLRDRDNEAQATRSKTRPTAEESNPLIAAAAKLIEKEVNVKDTRRTVDAIRAYDRSKDASRDADWDTTHGKKKKGDKEKKYAKKERGEIDKDDPNWKHRDYHTGMHGESKETENGERDVGSSQYLKYTTDLTPGQGITSPQAKKADVAKKIEQQRQRTAATGIDDAHQPGHKPGTPKPAPGFKSLKQKFKASRYAVRQKQARQDIATPKKEDIDLDAIIRKNLPETAVNPMGAPSNAPIGRSVIGDTAPEKLAPAKGASSSQASPSASVPGESGIEKVMDKINRIVKSGHSEKIHDKVIDKDTASAIQSTYAKVNASNQEKMEKIMSKDAAAMEKVSKFSKKNA